MNHITIETEKTDYTGGEIIKGRCFLELEDAIPARGIRIRFRGYEHSSWTTGTGKSRKTYAETRYFFNDEETLFGQPALSMSETLADAVKGIFSKEQYEILQPGRYEYDFSYQLPERLPGDFESGGSSKIAYEIIAYVDIPLKFDISSTKKLTFYETYDRGEIQSISTDSSKTFLLDSDNPLELAVTVDRNMAFPGEKLACELRVTNQSKKEIKAIIVTLQQIVDLKARKSTAEHTSITQLIKLESPFIPWGRPTTFDLELTLPDDLYCTITTSELVRVRYMFEFLLDVPWGRDLKVTLPMIIIEQAGRPTGIGTAKDDSKQDYTQITRFSA